jgi:cyclopropane-fatty-acyl-phospholipid synthase
MDTETLARERDDARPGELAGRFNGGYLRARIERALAGCDVILDGNRPWDLQVQDERLFRRVLMQGSLGLGEAYMDGWWECDQLDEFFHRLLRHDIDRRFYFVVDLIGSTHAQLVNLQSISRADRVARNHYDLTEDVFRSMLDSRRIYSCGYWQNASTLDEAQEAKLRLVCEKLHLRPGMRVLDIGCGWGGAARFAAEHYGVEVVGVTVSAEQARVGREVCRGFPVDIRLQDYREVEGTFDRVFSIGMFEHVGYKNYRRFMRVVRALLHDEGLFLLHTIGSLRSNTSTDPWIGRYIFPNSMLPSSAQIADASEGLFVIEDWHNFGSDYDTTLMHWFRNFERAWPRLAVTYDDRFYRMWRYYLLSCAGCFRARRNQLWQIVLSPRGVAGGYSSVR